MWRQKNASPVIQTFARPCHIHPRNKKLTLHLHAALLGGKCSESGTDTHKQIRFKQDELLKTKG